MMSLIVVTVTIAVTVSMATLALSMPSAYSAPMVIKNAQKPTPRPRNMNVFKRDACVPNPFFS